MNDLPRQKLCEIISIYGRSICNDPRRCEGLLRDFCGEYKREVSVLVQALKERVAVDLFTSSDGVPRKVLLARLTKRLLDNRALAEDAARWAVESWALALEESSSVGSDMCGSNLESVFSGSLSPVKKRPGTELATRPLHFIWICDCSASMGVDGKIQALNNAIREALPHMRQVADENPNAQVLVRALKFSSSAQWHISQPTLIDDFKWVDLHADGPFRAMGRALSMLAEQLKSPPMPGRLLPPVLVLISDGSPTDDFLSGLKMLMDQPWGKKAIRIAIAIGEDADHEVLQKFIGHLELKPLQANNPEALVKHIKWVSTDISSKALNETTT